MDALLSVVTVSWNVRECLVECIRSVARSAGEMPYEHVVVDNASSDGSADVVERLFPAVRVIRNAENVGYGRANNLAARQARGRHVLFLNPDTAVLGDALPVMVGILERDRGIGALGARILDSRGRWSREMGYRAPTLRTVINDFLLLSRVLPLPRLVPGIVRSRDLAGLEESEWVCGACLMVRREVLEQELWNEDIFMFAEELEYCERIRRRGWRICSTAEANVIHHSGRSISMQRDDFLAGKASALAGYVRAHQGRAAAWVAIHVIRLSLLVRCLYHRGVYRMRRDESALRKSDRLRKILMLEDAGDVRPAARASRAGGAGSAAGGAGS